MTRQNVPNPAVYDNSDVRELAYSLQEAFREIDALKKKLQDLENDKENKDG